MNRTIQFRAWDNKYKYMNYKILVGIYGEWEEVKDDKNYTSCAMWIEPKNVDYKCEPHWANFEPYHKDIVLMQYTGIKDKNGVKIYEGDILRTQLHWNGKKAGHLYKTVVYNKKNAGFNISERISNNYEIIGNIYENKVGDTNVKD